MVVLWLVFCCCHRSVSTIYGRIMVGLLVLSSVSKHNIWSYYGWVCRCCRRSVNTMHSHTGIMVDVVVFIISQ